MTLAKKDYAGIALKYAQDVLSGKIPACELTKQCAKRHIDDLEQSKDPGYPYYYSPDAGWKICHFAEQLPHTKGEWAYRRMNITLEPWQIFALAVPFGWLKKSDDLRRFVELYYEISRKNGKSVLAAVVGLYMFCVDTEYAAEVYSGANSEKQAWEVFRPAKLMVEKTPLLRDHFKLKVNAKSMVKLPDGARFEPLIGNPGDGASPSCALVDEWHESKTDALAVTMLTGMGARRSPIFMVITTAGYDISVPCFDKRREVVDCLQKTIPNDRLFGLIYTLDQEDEWIDPANLPKANPNIGVSVYREYLEDQLQRAINNPGFANKFKTKHLNIWTSVAQNYFNMVNWAKCEDKTLSESDFDGQPVNIGLDLARKLDLNAMVKVFDRDIDGKRHYYCVTPKFYCPNDTLWNVDNKQLSETYQKFKQQGELSVTDGAEVDYRYILEDIKALEQDYSINQVGIDPHGATAISHDLADNGIEPIIITQNFTNLSDPMKELEAAIESGRFHHDGNALMTWQASNVLGRFMPGNDDVVRPVKGNPNSKIDGMVALIMAIGRAMQRESNDNLSNHIEQHGIRSL